MNVQLYVLTKLYQYLRRLASTTVERKSNESFESMNEYKDAGGLALPNSESNSLHRRTCHAPPTL